MTSYLDNPGNQVVQRIIRMTRDNRHGAFWSHRELEEHREIAATTRAEGIRNIGRLIRAAEDAREHALSYRNFRVGAAAFAAFSGGVRPWSYRLIHGANAKPTGNNDINVHAEHTLMTTTIESAQPDELATIPIMMIMGDLQPDQQTGLETPTLHPCGVCRDAFTEDDSPITQETLIVTANPDLTIFEWFSVRALNRFHATGERRNMGLTKFSTRPISFGFVSPDPLTGTVDLSQFENDEYIESDREITMKLTLPLMEYGDSLTV